MVTRIFDFANEFMKDSNGLFKFVSVNSLLPLENNFASFEFVQEYFKLYPSVLDVFSVDELEQLLIKRLKFCFTP